MKFTAAAKRLDGKRTLDLSDDEQRVLRTICNLGAGGEKVVDGQMVFFLIPANHMRLETLDRAVETLAKMA